MGYEHDHAYLPGELVTCTVAGRPHIMIVSGRQSSAAVPLVMHSIGRGTQEEGRLFDLPVTVYYRVGQMLDAQP